MNKAISATNAGTFATCTERLVPAVRRFSAGSIVVVQGACWHGRSSTAGEGQTVAGMQGAGAGGAAVAAGWTHGQLINNTCYLPLHLAGV